jgi:hypothetical protein
LHKGWVCGRICDRKLLESLNIKLGGFNHEENVFENCLIPEAVFAQLDEHFGLFSWGLDDFEVKNASKM